MPEQADRSKAIYAVKLLGRFRVTRSGTSEEIRINSRRGRALLAYLAMHLDQPVQRAQIATLLWEDRTESASRHNLRQVLTELRDIIGGDLDDGITKDAVELRSAQFDVDAAAFAEHCRRATPGDLEAAVALYAGELSLDIDVKTAAFEEWVATERRRLHALALNAFDACVQKLTAAGRLHNALSVCENLLALDPIREATHRLLITLEAAVNGRSSALSRAAALAAILKKEVGVAPERATLELVDKIAAGPAGSGPAEPRENTNQIPLVPGPVAARRNAWPRIALAVAAIAALGAAWFALNNSDPAPGNVATTNTPALSASEEEAVYSIAVLPFSPRSADTRLAQFLGSLEQDLIDSFSRVTRFRVTSYLTSRTYRDSQQDAREIGKDLNVAFLLTGNADIEEHKIVVRAQLVDAQSAKLVWSGRFVYDADGDAVFDDIVAGISRELQIEVLISEGLRRERLERQQNPTYGDLIQRGVAESLRAFDNYENENVALELFEKALAINPDSISAKVGIARVLTRRIAELRSTQRIEDLNRADRMLTDALRADPDSSSARYFMGILRKMQGRIEDSIAEFEEALRINPSHANAHAQIGHSLIFLGRAQETEPYIHKAIRLSPRDPTISSWYFMAGQADIYLARYKKAIEWFEKSIAIYPKSGRAHIYLAAAYLLDGEKENAARAALRAKQLLPKLSARWLNFQISGKGHPDYVAQRERVVEATREALALFVPSQQ